MPRAKSPLGRLLSAYASYGAGAAQTKLEAMAALRRAELRTARDVLALHEALCFLRAYPDDAEVLASVEALLAGFARRADLRRHRRALANTGIAGTTIEFSFFAGPARRLAERWGTHLSIDWRRFDGARRLGQLLPHLALYAERPAFDDGSISARRWLAAYRGAGESDAAFLVRRWHALEAPEPLRSAFYDDLDPPLCLRPGPDTPCRTREKHAGLPVVFQTAPLVRSRPSLSDELGRPPARVRAVERPEAEALIELARDTMVPRERDLEVFAYGNPDDVRLIDAGGGLWFARIGVIPERRSLLEAVYGLLMLKNGVAIGYALASALFASSEIAYNVFETFRGGEAAAIFGRLLAVVHHQLGSKRFAIDPYQLGHKNDEGLRSGAFWFYQKLGFSPRDPEVVAVLEEELSRMRRRKGHRSSLATLKQLSRVPALWPAQPRRADMLGVLSPSKVALAVSRYVADRFGADRDRAARVCEREAAEACGLSAAEVRAWTPAERQAWRRWAPLMVLLGTRRWSAAERRALVPVIRAKGGTTEDTFVDRFERHERLRRAVIALAR
jgi:hypothetical protein